MRAAQTPPHLITLIFATALSVLSLNMFLPSLAHMSEDFGVDYGLMNLSVAGYLAVSAVLQLIMGPLSDRFGRRPILLMSMTIFVVASIGCTLAESIWGFLGFRLLQAAVVAGSVLSSASIRDRYPPNEAASKLGYVAMAMALAPMLGPMLGGGLDMLFGWRSGFVLYTMLGAGLLVLLWFDMGETNMNRSSTFTAQLREYPDLFRARRFWGYALCASFSIGGFYSFITGAPLVAAAWFDLSPAMLGLGIGIITGGFMVGNFVTGRIAARTRLTTMILIGRIVASTGPFCGLLLFLAGLGSVWVFFGSAICVGFGNGLTNANAAAGVMSVRPRLAGSAAGLSGAMVVALGAILTSMTGAFVSPENGPFLVLGMMWACSFAGLLAVLYVRRLDRIDPLPDTF
ncbi:MULTISPECIES: multidrug effflux MFS transporter [unclassified Ruegeria]|uniref:multidrug effflux MFS transporter n=1 Tax=unclassified Ruegeria TaxID=2625375 RepID=UPI001488AA8E|nr:MULTISPECIES: multidrug effflux MFS transporter [unclassified Ruegeria]NOD75186.1 Bcr/CflA family efflux MFS transporter [Ruegeria sp. HKCCD4332]NOD87147.1 Bcr/CflA family efflux MFS transporter [Ruegeria sp. HKCCD4318]NOE12702.1 Bcr/CflA family efflux MFS transporter [Ruegeria sp. HKCCD4318-2]NOG09133.1 multidrug effflux MFS transporter [Ruegeria sp. HKCCD4315]